MRNKLKNIFIIIIVAIVAYFLGMLFPIKNILPLISKNTEEVSSYERWVLVANYLLAFLALVTVIVALFKEEITSLWRKPKLCITQKEDSSLLVERLKENTNNGNNEADCYDVLISIKNDGIVDAKNLKVKFLDAFFINPLTQSDSKILLERKIISIEECQYLPRYSSIDVRVASLMNRQKSQEKTEEEGAGGTVPRSKA